MRRYFKNEQIDQLIKKKIMDTNYYTAACGLEGSFSQLIFQFFFFINFL